MKPETIESLREMYERVDGYVEELLLRLGERITCKRGCAGCCVDGLTVFEIEAEYIRHQSGELLASEKPHARGACAFLDDDGGCRIYDDRPYVCRTQGLPLRWFETEDDGRMIEMRDICPRNDSEDERVEHLPSEECWLIGPFEGRLAELQREEFGELRRVSLRGLWGG